MNLIKLNTSVSGYVNQTRFSWRKGQELPVGDTHTAAQIDLAYAQRMVNSGQAFDITPEEQEVKNPNPEKGADQKPPEPPKKSKPKS